MQEGDCAAAVTLATEKYGKLNVMFNNAGIMHSDDGDTTQTSDDVFDLTMDINVKVGSCTCGGPGYAC